MKAFKLGCISGSRKGGVTLGSLLNQKPIITNVAVSLIGDETFTVTATVDPKGTPITPVLHYGLTTAYGATVNATEGEISAAGTVTFTVTGLAQNTTYNYKIVAGVTETANATQATTNVRWIIPFTGQTTGTPTAGTMVISTTEDITPTVTGDVTISVERVDDSTYRKHTITVNCPNNGSGNIVIPDRSKVVSLGDHAGASSPVTNFYTGTNTTSPKLSWNFNNIPATTQKIRQSVEYTTILPATGNSAFPSGLVHLNLHGSNVNWTYTGALPTGLTFMQFNGSNINWTYSGALPTGLTSINLTNSNINWTYNGSLPTGLTFFQIINVTSFAWTYTGALPTGLTFINVDNNNIAWTYSGALPTGLTRLTINSINANWTGLDIGNNGNITNLTLLNYRIAKMSSTDMVTLLTQLTNRTGSLPNTITINDYADYASPPTTVTNAVAALKAAKPNITTVNLGA